MTFIHSQICKESSWPWELVFGNKQQQQQFGFLVYDSDNKVAWETSAKKNRKNDLVTIDTK